jgi:hypothetical protein
MNSKSKSFQEIQMNSRILKLQLNEPETIALATVQTMDVFNDYGKPQVLFCLADQRRLYATPELARQIKSLGVKELESFGVRKWKKGRNVHYDVWLSPATEKAKAIEEAPAVAAELSNLVAMPQPQQESIELAPTGTEGRAIPAPRRSLALSQPPNVIPFNVAFREIAAFVQSELKVSGQEWTDASRQDLCSTVLIGALQKGWVGIWEREK